MDFQTLNLSKDYQTSSNTFSLNGQQIEVLRYLPVSDKNDLITVALQKADEDGIYNDLLLDVYFHLNILYLYTNIEFSMEDRIDEMGLYDILESNGVIDSVIANMDQDEYKHLYDTLEIAKENHLRYGNSAAGIVRKLITDLPASAQAAAEFVDNFTPEKYQEVVDFARAANGGRDINTQQEPIRPFPQPQDHLEKQPKRKVISVESATKKD